MSDHSIKSGPSDAADLVDQLFASADRDFLRSAISRDEGASWQHQLVAHTKVGDLYTTSVATDSSGSVYIAWIAGKGRVGAGVSVTGLPYLTISRNHGRTWSKPIMIAAPVFVITSFMSDGRSNTYRYST